MTASLPCRVRAAIACCVLSLFGHGTVSAAFSELIAFELDGVDLGAIQHIGDFDWSDTLEYRWDRDFSLGGILGKQNATVIPEIRIPVPFSSPLVIPGVYADTRTGARFSGNITGGIGLEFFADFSASGLTPGNAFDFRPTVTAPASVDVGDFFRLNTSTGLQVDPAFTADRVQLPSFEAGMDLLFDLAINGKVEGGLFPIIPYGSAPIAMDKPWSVQQSLINFGFDLNPGTVQAPALTFLKDTFIEQTYAVVDPDISSMSVQLSYGPPTNRIDLGEIQIINPFGADESIIGGSKPNLSINTSMDASSVGFSFETPLLRMGLDLDGIAGYLVTGAFGYPTSAVTRFDAEIDDFAKVYLELIDIKYGPEIGYRERVDIRPDFLVTLEFDKDVSVRTTSGFEQVNQFTGLWSDLPEFALLADAPVEVTVNFDALVGEQAKWGAFYLTDYLQITALEGGLGLFDTLDLSFPPLLQYRTSLLGSLGEVELDVFRTTQAIAPIGLENMTGSFWLYPREGDSRLLYWASQADDDPGRLDRWATLAFHSTPGGLTGSVLLVGRGDGNAGHVGQLLPMTLTDSGAETGEEPLQVDELRILPGSMVIQSGLRKWQLGKVHNDGLYLSDGATEFRNWVGQQLHITGEGEMRFTGLVSIGNTQELVHGQGHTLVFQGAQGLDTTDRPLMVNRLDNQGTIIFEDMAIRLPANVYNRGTIIFDNTTTTEHLALYQHTTGSLVARGGAVVSFWGLWAPSGLLTATGSGSQLILNDGSPIYAPSPWPEGFVILASDGGEVLGSPPIRGEYSSYLEIQNVLAWNREESPGAADRPLTRKITFRAEEDGHINFTGPIKQTLGVSTRFEIAAGGEMALGGTRLIYMRNDISDIGDGDDWGPMPPEPGELVLDPSWMPDLDAIAHPLRAMAGQMFSVENHGTLNVFGSNRLYLKLLLPDDLAPAIHPHDRALLLNMQPNLINTGHIIVHEGASLGFQIRIADESARRMVFDEGTWSLLGGHVEVEPFGVTWPQGSPDSESPYYYMAVNASNVTLSGDALFPFFNTVAENRGTIVLCDGQHFTTSGDLLNRGEIRVESGATLRLPASRLTIDEGAVFIDGASGASLVGAASIEVVGGTFTNALPAGAVTLTDAWIVRETWLGADLEGNDIVVPASVSFGDAWIGEIASTGSVTLDGREASMTPLMRLAFNRGSLSLTGGNVLALEQDLHNAATGTLSVRRAAQLLIDGSLTSHGELIVGPEGYLQATAVHLLAGSAVIDGVLDTLAVSISDNVAVTGSTLITGSLSNAGQLAVGSSAGIMEVFGGVNQTDTGSITFEIFGQAVGESFDQLILHAGSEFQGELVLIFGEAFTPRFGRQWHLVDAREALDGSGLAHIAWLFDEISVIGLDPLTADPLAGALPWHVEDVLLGMYLDMPVMLSFHGGSGEDMVLYTIPEPGTLALLTLGGLLMLRRRRS